MEVKISSPDYTHWTKQEDIFSDFEKRIKHYELVYETIGSEECAGKISFVKVVNIGKQVILNLVQVRYYQINLRDT